MLIGSLLIAKLSIKMTVALIIGAIVIFFVCLFFKKQRQDKTILFALIAVVLYATSFLVAEMGYYKAKAELGEVKEFTGVICEIPKYSDEALAYVVKPDNENYKIRYVTHDNKELEMGDRVKVNAILSENEDNYDYFENSLASKVYFTVFEGEKTSIEKTGETHFYYSVVGKFKNWYSDVVNTYLPNEIGEIAKAMTIGEKSGIDWNTIEKFSNSGTSHILVISGLHLSIWIMGITKILEKFCKSNRTVGIAGLACLFIYSAIIGFTPSVVRAGMMVGMVFVGKIVSRPADSINSVGIAVAILLLLNPFAVMSLSFWFTILSTMGILLLPNNMMRWLKNTKQTANLFKNKLMRGLFNLITLSLSITIVTVPVFIAEFGMLPIASLLGNILIVDLALIMMILTVLAVVCHILHLFTVSNMIFILVGGLGRIIKFLASEIGMAEWSTISVSHEYFQYFLVIVVICICVALLVKRVYKDIVKHISVFLAVVFILLCVYTTYYDYSNPSVDIVFTDDKPIVLVNSHGETFMIGIEDEDYNSYVKEMMHSHNKKIPDALFVYDKTAEVFELTAAYDEFGTMKTYFYGEAPKLFKDEQNDNVKNLLIGDNVSVEFLSETEMVITNENQKLLFLDCKENVFKNYYEYDIIILYGENSEKSYKELVFHTETSETEVILARDFQTQTIYLNGR